MAFRLKETDCSMLKAIAEHRMLTVSQMASLVQKNKKALWRRLGDLEREKLIKLDRGQFGRSRGRPESLVSVSRGGVGLLRRKDLIDPAIPHEKLTAEKIHCSNHQLVLNWFRVHLNLVERMLPRLSVEFLAYNSPFLPRNPEGWSIITDCVSADGSNDDPVRFTSDAAFSIHDAVYDMTLLSFLEVDCGTETVVSPKRAMTDMRQKIVNYQSYFRSGRYKRYEKLWNCRLNGFRLLFLTNTEPRLVSLCRLVQEMAPSDFVWLTEQRRMLSEGLCSRIWARGGRLNAPQCSILGGISAASST